MTKKISFILLITMILQILLTSCVGSNGQSEVTAETTEEKTLETTSPVMLGDNELKNYSLIYTKGSEIGKELAEKTALLIEDLTGLKLEVFSDEYEEDECEILVGASSRDESIAYTDLWHNEYIIAVRNKKLILSAGTVAGFKTIEERLKSLMNENKLTDGFEEKEIYETGKLNGAKVMFIGNSFLYYGQCTTTKSKIVFDDQGYFNKVAKGMEDDTYVTSITYGGKGLKALYEILTENHPKHYGTEGEMDEIYNQQYVILQQEGSNASSTEEYSYKLMELFPPETRFCFFVHHHNAQHSHANVLNTAAKLRDENNVIYISAGHLIYDIWTGRTKVPGATLRYNKNSFVVNHSDSHHPNYLNGYLTALTCYYAITGISVKECPHDFVKKTMEYYTKAESNYDKILESDADMKGLKQLVEEYSVYYNKKK